MSSPVFIVNLTLYQINGVLNWSLITTGRSEPNANVKKRLKKKSCYTSVGKESGVLLMSLFGKNKNIEVSNQISKSEKKVVMETIDPINFMGDLFILIIP